MITLTLVALSLLSFSQLVTSEKYAQMLCRTEDDCFWDQCCIVSEVRLPGFNGICSPPTQKGEYCNPDPNDQTGDGRYKTACPCDRGLTCKPKQETNMGKVHNICQPLDGTDSY